MARTALAIFAALLATQQDSCCHHPVPPPPAPTAPGPYRVADLGPGRCVAINAAGMVVGSDEGGLASGPEPAGFIIAPGGARTALGNLDPGDLIAMGAAIDSAGRVVGFAQSTSSRHAAFWANGTVKPIGALTSGDWSFASGIDDSGRIVGASRLAPLGTAGARPPMHAFLYDTTMRDLGTLGGANSAAQAIVGGKVVGSAETAGGATHAFLYDGAMHDLGTLGGENSNAYGINAKGVVVGVAATASGDGHAFVFDGTMHDIHSDVAGTAVRSDARGIDDSGVVVGNTRETSGGGQSFAWRAGQRTYLIGPGGPSILRVESVAPNGLIVGYGVGEAGDGGLLTPHCLVWSVE